MDAPSVSLRVGLAAVFIALGVVLAPFHFPVGPTKCYPFQHMVNALVGIFLGPWYAAAVATAIGVIRNMLGVGTIFAFPGGIPGGVVVGIVHRYVRRTDYAALAEPLGTVVIGATLSALAVGPMIGRTMSLLAFWVAFSVSSIPGSALGFLVVKVLRRTGVADRIFLR